MTPKEIRERDDAQRARATQRRILKKILAVAILAGRARPQPETTAPPDVPEPIAPDLSEIRQSLELPRAQARNALELSGAASTNALAARTAAGVAAQNADEAVTRVASVEQGLSEAQSGLTAAASRLAATEGVAERAMEEARRTPGLIEAVREAARNFAAEALDIAGRALKAITDLGVVVKNLEQRGFALIAHYSNGESRQVAQIGSVFVPGGGGGGGVLSDTQLLAIRSAFWPVGSLFTTTVNTNPAALLGFGTWTALGAGRTLVGFDGADADFNAAKKLAGAKTVAAAGSNSAPVFTGDALATHNHAAGTLLPSAHTGTAVADHASHTHQIDPPATTTTAAPSQAVGIINLLTTAAPAGHTHSVDIPAFASGAPSATLVHAVTQPADHTMSGNTAAASAGTPSGSVSAPVFTGSPTSVVQPSIVVFFWERTL